MVYLQYDTNEMNTDCSFTFRLVLGHRKGGKARKGGKVLEKAGKLEKAYLVVVRHTKVVWKATVEEGQTPRPYQKPWREMGLLKIFTDFHQCELEISVIRKIQ